MTVAGGLEDGSWLSSQFGLSRSWSSPFTRAGKSWVGVNRVSNGCGEKSSDEVEPTYATTEG